MNATEKRLTRLKKALNAYFKADFGSFELLLGVDDNPTFTRLRAAKEGKELAVTLLTKISEFAPPEKAKKGKANGNPYWAWAYNTEGKRGYVVYVQADDLRPLLGPGKIATILGRVDRHSTPVGNDFAFLGKGVLTTTAISILDYQEQAKVWNQRNQAGLGADQNPLAEGVWVRQKIRVFHMNDRKNQTSEVIDYPRSEKEAAAFLLKAFGPTGVSVLIALSWFASRNGDQRSMTISLHELCRRMYGAKPAGGSVKKAWEALNALHYSEIRISGTLGTGNGLYKFSPVKVPFEFRKHGNESGPPDRVQVELWPGLVRKKKDSFLVPEAIFGLRETELPLACLVLRSVGDNRHWAKDDKPMKIRLKDAIRAARLGGTFRSNPRKAKNDLRGKLTRMENAGLCGEVLDIKSDIVYLRHSEALRRPERVEAGPNKGKPPNTSQGGPESLTGGG